MSAMSARPRRGTPVPVLTLAVLALALALPARAAAAFDYLGSWGGVGSADGQLNAIQDLDTDPGGRVYTVESGNQRVQRFDRGGTFQLKWGNPGPGGSTSPGQFSGPRDIAVGSDLRVYVADSRNNRIQWFTPEGVLDGAWGSEGTGDGQFNSPDDIATGPDGSVYVADFGNSRIERFTRDGAFLGSWGAPGSGAGQFGSISGVAAGPDGSVYVAEQANRRVQRFSATGALLGTWGGEGSIDGRFLSPSAIDVGPNGAVFVADSGRDDVQVFTADGAFAARFGGPGTGNGQFEIPIGIAVGPDGSVYVADNNQERIQHFGTLDPNADSDGDGLLDRWEVTGYDADNDGDIDVDLPRMGANYLRRDIFVELDHMKNHGLDAAAIETVVAAFARAPVTNPGGDSGIALHVDNGSTSRMHGTTTWGALSGAEELSHQNPLGRILGVSYDWSPFDALKRSHFAAARAPTFHYAISVHQFDNTTSSGISRGIGASDFIVSLGGFCSSGDCSGTTAQQAGTFMHELGHNLGLRHGGGDDVNRKPNFLSIMNYAFQLSGLIVDAKAGTLDYSRFPTPGVPINVLTENRLDEQAGFGGEPGSQLARMETTWGCPNGTWTTGALTGSANFDCDDKPAETDDVAVNLNRDGIRGNTLSPWADWPGIVFDGGAVGAGGTAGAPLPDRTTQIEPSKRVLFQTAQVVAGDRRRPKVTISGRRRAHARLTLTIRATDAKALDRIVVVVDGASRQIRAARRRTKTYRLRLGRGRHRVRASALDAAGNASRTVRRTVVVTRR